MLALRILLLANGTHAHGLPHPPFILTSPQPRSSRPPPSSHASRPAASSSPARAHPTPTARPPAAASTPASAPGRSSRRSAMAGAGSATSRRTTSPRSRPARTRPRPASTTPRPVSASRAPGPRLRRRPRLLSPAWPPRALPQPLPVSLSAPRHTPTPLTPSHSAHLRRFRAARRRHAVHHWHLQRGRGLRVILLRVPLRQVRRARHRAGARRRVRIRRRRAE
jgi:hypothetical protein